MFVRLIGTKKEMVFSLTKTKLLKAVKTLNFVDKFLPFQTCAHLQRTNKIIVSKYISTYVALDKRNVTSVNQC